MTKLQDSKQGTSTKNSVKTEIETTCDSIKELLVAKNNDYGNSVLSKSPLTNVSIEDAIAIRIGDKFNRLSNLLLAKERQVKEESIDDTIKDIAGYCVMWIIARKSN